jgi:hypothetical protein
VVAKFIGWRRIPKLGFCIIYVVLDPGMRQRDWDELIFSGTVIVNSL